jgi:tRNA-specific 2-thiouridylase
MAKIKAVGLLSGGLDSTLAAKLVKEQGLDVEAVTFVTPFCSCGSKASQAAKTLNIPLKVFDEGKEYVKMVRNPKFGYGKNMNPCVDCKIFMLKKAKRYAKEIGAKFVFTGEVLGQRPMSQHKQELCVIEKEAGLTRKIVRPLSAKLLPKTEAEFLGFINSNGLEDISGRSRKRQLEMAKKFNINSFPSPAGGCLLTEQELAKKLKDLFKHRTRVSLRDVNLLKVGRHFRLGSNKIIVGRNELENSVLLKNKLKSEYIFEVPVYGSPTTLLTGPKEKKAIQKAAELTAFYSDNKNNQVQVKFGQKNLTKEIKVTKLPMAEVNELRI